MESYLNVEPEQSKNKIQENSFIAISDDIYIYGIYVAQLLVYLDFLVYFKLFDIFEGTEK